MPGFDLDLGFDFVFLALVAMSNMLTCSCFFPFAGDAKAGKESRPSHSEAHRVTRTSGGALRNR